VGIVRTIIERGMWRSGVMGDAQGLPLRNVVVRNIRIIGRIGGVAGKAGNVGHSSDANDTLEGEIRLVPRGSV